jgi:hypothetical protein
MTFDPNHYYYNPLGEPITLMEWAEAREGAKATLRQDEVKPDVLLKTVYLGFVCPHTHGARLFGTALVALPSKTVIGEVQLYDSEVEAMAGHMNHLDAIAAGHHCYRCRIGDAQH